MHQQALVVQKKGWNKMVEDFCIKNSPRGEGLPAFKFRVERILASVGRFAPQSNPEERTLIHFTVATQGLLLAAVYSDVDAEAKVRHLRNNHRIRISPDDAVFYTGIKLITASKRAQYAAEEARATADAAVAESGAASAFADWQAVATVTDNTVTTAECDALYHRLRASEFMGIAPFPYDRSALHAILRRGSTEQLHILFSQGLLLNACSASRAMRAIIRSDKLAAKASAELLQDVLVHMDNNMADIKLRYVDPIDDLTVVGAAVRQGRVDLVCLLLDRDPGAVNVAGAHLRLTPAHCVTQENTGGNTGVVACAGGCTQPNCNNAMNWELYRRGADPDRKDWQENTPSLCPHGQKEAAKAMCDAMKAVSKMLQRAYRKKAMDAPGCILHMIESNIMRLIIFPMLGFAPKAVVCRASITQYPWFPRNPPVRGGAEGEAPLAEGGGSEDGAGAAP